MLNRIFYNSTTRKLAILTGSLFNDIVVRRVDNTGKSVTTFTVPIQYAAKRKWVQSLNGETNRNVAMQLPRMSFSFTGFNYDSARQTSSINKLIGSKNSLNEKLVGFNAIPYKVNVDLNIAAKNTDDMFQIIEQIIPFFTPSFTTSAKLIPDLDYNFDVIFRYSGSPSIEDVYDGQFEQRQVIIATLSFEVDYWYFGPFENSKIIKRVTVNVDQTSMTVTPGLTNSGLPTTDSSLSKSPLAIYESDDYGFATDYTDNL